MITSKNTADTVSTLSLNFCQETEGTRHFLCVEIVSSDTLAGHFFFFSEHQVSPNPSDPSQNEEVYDDDASTSIPVTNIESAADHFSDRHRGINNAMAKQYLATLLNAYDTLRVINSRQGLTLGQ